MTVAPPVTRRVEHVMGLPISLALRGRQADGPAADTAWAAVLASLRDADQVFSTYRADSVVRRINLGELALGDARTGAAPAGIAGVTVLAASLTDADVDATAAYALGPDALTWLRRRVGRTGLVVWADGTAEPFSAALGRSTA
ncbi:hypothetical protein [Actinomycetospora sp. NBRC 106378]|uniref:hypothetical protein n=1 Tax=Actinomycetospora sp. NBRC 106378 TaxID=3032208 RepID=UPI0024A3B623|nr:hypothetical protein [Actinomycetospora sp. NBRC 106378]GLZ55583.1 hypothetical protein Acsp07_52000 [Actinomycetospora sp. NBRC 106378]